MKRRFSLSIAAFALLAPAAPLLASGDYSCEPTWSLFNRDFNCADSAVLSPGNDSRVNLLYLLRDKQGASSAGLSHPGSEWETRAYGHTFFDWGLLRLTFYPKPLNAEDASASDDQSGSRCVSLASGDAGFAAALRASGKLPATERVALLKGREVLTARCGATDANFSPAWPSVSSASGKEFLVYLQAADAFYAGQWDAARQGFAGLRKSRDPWLAETAAYMAPRVELNAAQEHSFNEWGDLDRDKAADKVALAGSRAGFQDYLKRYAKGRYADSAQGLIRRTFWLERDAAGLAREYERLLAATPATQDAAAQLVQEIDNKLLIPRDGVGQIDGPLLLATIDLMMMRGADDSGGGETEHPPITAAQIAAQESRFAGRADLFSFVQANHALYVAKDYRRVLQLIPDDAKRTAFSSLQFSRQVLRGMALNQLKDRNEAGFWREMLGGADKLYQRPAVELALAMNWERGGKLGEVFAPTSPITDSSIREILMLKVAGPDILRGQARDASRPQHERDVALFTLLYQELRRGGYSAFLADSALVSGGANTDGGVWDLQQQEKVPVGLFRAGAWAEDYACPALAVTAGTLARDPRDAKARLCLGEFYRINGFDGYGEPHEDFEGRPKIDELGGTPSLFPGHDMPRGAIYADIIADAKAPAPEKAYALYRAINCYAPAGSNACGGAEVDKSQRQAWFQRLKRDYAASPWAAKAKYYW
jgi:hypothetical protein